MSLVDRDDAVQIEAHSSSVISELRWCTWWQSQQEAILCHRRRRAIIVYTTSSLSRDLTAIYTTHWEHL